MKEKILLVEDEELLRFTMNNFLLREGYTIFFAGDFEEAVDILDIETMDLIIADIMLTGTKTGMDLLREVKKRNTHCPVIMVTGYPNLQTASESVRFNAFDYLFKPVRKDTLLYVVKKALDYKKICEENEKYRLNLDAIFRSVSEGIIAVDKNLIVIEMNDVAEELCGFSRTSWAGKNFASLLSGHCKKCLELLEKTIKTKEKIDIKNFKCELKDGHDRVLTITTSPLINKDGLFLGAVLVLKDETHINYLEEVLNERSQFHNITGKSDIMRQVYKLIETLADISTTVLVTGESGTGKELVAEALHYTGTRRDKALVKVNCSALSENLLESELFGHVKGAFTGAIKDRKGRFLKAHKGTIFLDEIGDISPLMQSKLLRVIQEGEFESVGSSTTIRVDARVVAATNQDLPGKVKAGLFREDLYYRLNVVEIKLPPLRERKIDIPLLAGHFLKKFNKKFNKQINGISENVLNLFMNYPWPGNIRELEHAIEHAFILCNESLIDMKDLPGELLLKKKGQSFINNIDEREKISDALIKTDGNKAKAARLLSMSRPTLYEKIKYYKLERSEK
jgi:PAS domain S-box-containing protein